MNNGRTMNFTPIDYNPFEQEREIEKIVLTNEPQREMWLSCIIGGTEANLSYNESISLVLTGELDVAAFRYAVDELVRRHEALRCTISPNGELLIVYKKLLVKLDLTDITYLDADGVRGYMREFLEREIAVPLDLQKGQLFRVFLHQTGEQEHYFTIIRHHIIGDGWSTGIILEDLGNIYNARVKGEELLIEPAMQISDYASAEAAFARTPAYTQTLNYWLDQYKDEVPLLDLPTDRPRPNPKTYKGHRIDDPLSRDMAEQARALGAKASSSLVTTLLAAFEVFLYKITQQSDIVVGLPASGQAASGLTNVVGHCVNLLPLRSRIDPSASFLDYLRKRRKEVLDAYDHQRLTFGELLKKLYIPRDPSRIPLVPVMFNIDMGMDNAVGFEGLSYKLVSNPRAYENFEIYLNATGSKDGIVLEWSYNTDLFDASTMESFNQQFHTILANAIADPGASIATLAGLEDVPLSIVEGPEMEIAAGTTINSLFASATARNAYGAAVSCNGNSLTYGQLLEQTQRFAALLSAKGIGKGSIVAISLPRSVEMLAAMLAVLQSGAAYLPLDPEYPAARIGYMLEDSGASLLISAKDNDIPLPTGCDKLAIEDAWNDLDSYQPADIASIEESDIAYILYTSGSTGNPKGVRVTHGNLANFLLSMQAAPGITAEDRLLAVTTISFDIAGLELYLPLVAGAEVILADTDTARDGRLLLQLIEDRSISMMQATPSTWQMMLDSGWDKHYSLMILSGGEALPADLAQRLLERGAGVWNMYGPTETTIWSATCQVAAPARQITIGKPIHNTVIIIADEHGNPLPLGQVGEICIGGAGVAAGYLNRKELTAEKFIQSTNGDTLYRTGDQGKLLPNSDILCMGRMDQQVKIRGHRIELGEIESALVTQEGVKQAVVVAREDVPGDKRLVAYVTLDEDAPVGKDGAWKDRWDALYEIGARDKRDSNGTIDGTLLEHHQNAEELTKQLAEWLAVTTARIKEIGSKRIYEIGCGAGQLLFELAPDTDYYMATDYAAAAIDNIKKHTAADPEKWAQVNAAVAPANDFSAIGNERLDLVIINSVAQYFPDAAYLVDVIKQAANALGTGGCIFLGDMQGMGSLAMHHAADHLQRAAADTTVAAFNEVVANRVRIEEELVADPAFFYLLPRLVPGITGVNIQLRRGQSINETTKYHYDVWLYVNQPVNVVAPTVNADWKDLNDTAALSELLAVNNNAVVAISGIPNSRTAADHALHELLQTAEPATTVTSLQATIAHAHPGIAPDAIWDLGTEAGFNTNLRWTKNGTDNLFDAVFIPSALQGAIPASPIADTRADIYNYARTPLANKEIALPTDMIQAWKDKLGNALPAYMVPDTIVALKTFPLTPNAKIDRKSLPKPQMQVRASSASERTALTANEQLVRDIWAETLGLADLRPTDDFFQLGGHSLLAVKVMVAIEQKTGIRLPIAALFANSTIEKLAAQISGNIQEKKWDALVPIKTTGSKTPLFLIHGGGLNVMLFKGISDYFGEEQPVYGLQALGLNHETSIPGTIEAIASRYLQEIIKVYPSGPYALAGYSLGGFLAFEIAKQLMAMDQQVSFVGIMDTYAGNNVQIEDTLTRVSQKVARQFRKIPFYAKSFVNNPKESLEYQWVVTQKRFQKLQSSEVMIPKDTFTDYEAGIYRAYSDALDAYVLTPGDVRVTLFRVQKRLYFLDDLATLGWDRFARKGVDVREVPGDHETFLYNPYALKFAVVLQQALDGKGGLK